MLSSHSPSVRRLVVLAAAGFASLALAAEAPAASKVAPKSKGALAPPKAEAAKKDAAPVTPKGWTAVTVKEEGFTVAFPQKPQTATSTEETEAGPVPTTMHSIELPTGFYAVSVSKFPEAVASADPAVVLTGAQEGAMANIGAKLTSERALSETAPEQQSVPGREYTGTAQGTKVAARIFMRGATMYQLILVQPEAAASEAEFARFADSFKFIAR